MKNENKKIPTKNYIIVIIVFIIIMAITIGIKIWHQSYRDYQLTIPIISGEVQEINYEEFDNYIMEHDEFLLYIGVADDNSCREFEKDLISILDKRNIREELLYLNITKLPNKEVYLGKLVEKYSKKKFKIDYPTFIIIDENRFVDFVSKNSSGKIHISEIEKILDLYEIGE